MRPEYPPALPERVVVSGVIEVDRADTQARAPERGETCANELAHERQPDLRRNDPGRPDKQKAYRDQQGYAGVNRHEPGGREAAQSTTPQAQQRIGGQGRGKQQSDENRLHMMI